MIRNMTNEHKRQLTVVLTCREAMSRMKEGEEEKTKSYTALVWTQKPIQSEDIAFIDDIKVTTTHRHSQSRQFVCTAKRLKILFRLICDPRC